MKFYEAISVSKWQGEMNWKKAAEMGVKAAVIRAGSIDSVTGKCYEDYQFRRNADLAPQEIPNITYYFFMRPAFSAQYQAEYFMNLVRDSYRNAPLVNDIEVEGSADVVRTFTVLTNSVIYTNYNTFTYLLKGDTSWAKSYPLYIASYDVPSPRIPKPWDTFVAWQYAVKKDGLLYGAQSKTLTHEIISTDLFTSNEPGEKIMKYKVLVEGLKIRTAPKDTAPIIGSRSRDEVITPLETIGDTTYPGAYWVRDEKGWSAAQYYYPTRELMKSIIEEV